MITNDFYISLRKTKVVDIDKDAHKLPPDWGPFKEFKVADYYCPKEWSNDGIFVSVKEGEPLWIDFQLNNSCAVIPSVQRLNPITGESADLENGLKKDPKQNYLVLPGQKWLDGYAKEGKVYQFVVTKAGESLAVNEYVLPVHMQDSHALGFAFFEPKNPPRPTRGRDKNSITEIFAGGMPGGMSMAQPMWYSPLHTPQNWKTAAKRKLSGVLANITTKGTTTKGICGQSSGTTTCDFDGITTNDSDSLVAGTEGAKQRYTQNRVADNYNEIVEAGGLVGGEAGAAVGGGEAGAAVGGEEAACEETLCRTGGYSEDHIDVVDILDSRFADQVEEVDDTDLDKASMGMGGRIEQNITTDNNTVEYYKEKPSAVLTVYMALPEQFDAIMERGKRQDSSREDRHVHSGDIGGVPVPLIKAEV